MIADQVREPSIAWNGGEQLPNAWDESNGPEVARGCRVIFC